MSRFTISMPCPADAIPATDAFAAQIGRPMLLTTEGPLVTTECFILRDAKVAADGARVTLTYETPSLEEALAAGGFVGMVAAVRQFDEGMHQLWNSQPMTPEQLEKLKAGILALADNPAPEPWPRDQRMTHATTACPMRPEWWQAIREMRNAHGLCPWFSWTAAAERPSAAEVNEAVTWWNRRAEEAQRDHTERATQDT